MSKPQGIGSVRTSMAAAICAAVIAALGEGACSTSPGAGLFGPSKRTATVLPGEFAKAPPAPGPSVPETVAPAQIVEAASPPPARTPDQPSSARAVNLSPPVPASPLAGGPQTNLATSAGPPPDQAASAPSTAPPVTIDALVGQINGKPVIASEIFEPLDGRLRALAASSKDALGWRMESEQLIAEEVGRRVNEELVLSEARRELTPEQQAGVRHFLETIRSGLISQQHGSAVEADEQSRETTGRTLNNEAQSLKDRGLIRHELQNRVEPRVVVSWRDVQTEYERRYARYHPPAEYFFRMIYVAADNSAGIETIRSALASGRPFAEVAADPANQFDPKKGGEWTRKAAGPQNAGEFHAVPELNAAMRTLGVGQTAGPITYEVPDSRLGQRRTAWVYLERIDRPAESSLYDVQLDILEELRAERFAAELSRYMRQLQSRGNVTDMRIMTQRLADLATDRYAPRFRAN